MILPKTSVADSPVLVLAYRSKAIIITLPSRRRRSTFTSIVIQNEGSAKIQILRQAMLRSQLIIPKYESIKLFKNRRGPRPPISELAKKCWCNLGKNSQLQNLYHSSLYRRATVVRRSRKSTQNNLVVVTVVGMLSKSRTQGQKWPFKATIRAITISNSILCWSISSSNSNSSMHMRHHVSNCSQKI